MDGSFSDRFLSVMEQRRLSVTDVATALDISRQAVHKWIETGGISDRNLRQLADLLQVSPAWLRYGVGPRNPADGEDKDERDLWSSVRRKLVSEVLSNEQRLLLAMQVASVSIWEYEIVQERMFWSRNTPAVLGVEKSQLGRTLQWLVELVHVDDRANFEARLSEVLTSNESDRQEFRIELPDGRTRWMACWITQHTNDNDRVTGLIGALQDITEQKQNENLVSCLGRVLDSSTNEIFMFHAEDLHFVHVNRGGVTNTGYTLSELKKMTPLELKPELSRDALAAILQPLRSGEKTRMIFESVHLRKDGTRYPVEVQLEYFSAEDPPLFLAVIMDITERMRQERELCLRAQLLNGLQDSVIATDLDGRVVFWSRGAEALYGFSAEEVTGRNITFIVDSENADDGRDRMASVIRNGLWKGRYWQRRKSGTRFLADSIISLVRDEHGTPCGFIGIDRDITELT
jgi:PAS domain S-box-containing protein